MMKIRKRIMAFVLSVLIVITLLPVQALERSFYIDENYKPVCTVDPRFLYSSIK